MGKVVIIGGGVIGLSTAWELHRRGEEVIVLDSRSAGMAASAVNAGWVSPAMGPVPAPGLVLTSMKWMLNPESPLYIKPRLDPRFAAWLFRFWRACNPAAFEAGVEATGELGLGTMAIMDRWADEDGIDFEMHKYGLLYAFRHREEMEAELRSFETWARYEYAYPQALYGDDLLQKEPVLSEDLIAGFLVEEERTVQPITLVRGLIAKLQEVGVEVRNGAPIVDIEVSNKRVTAVRTPSERIAADHVLIAAGAWTRSIGNMAGARLPIEAGKGYGLDFKPSPVKPNSSIYLPDARIAVSPFDQGLRLSGTMELSGISDTVAARRIGAIQKGGQRFLKGFPKDVEPTQVWAGMRPMAPDGLPILGNVKGFNNLTVASGHAMLGVTLAAVTAVHMADLISTGTTPDVLKPFSPDRFKGFL